MFMEKCYKTYKECVLILTMTLKNITINQVKKGLKNPTNIFFALFFGLVTMVSQAY